MKNNKRYIIILFSLLLFLLILIFAVNKNHFNTNNISINGTYKNNLNPFDSLVFDEETMKYYNYTQYEKSEGMFEKKENNSYILKTGDLKGREVTVDKEGINVIDENGIEVYERISNIPTIQDEN
ncbi:MAG: hypothetical protein ACRCX2_03160 [Paraclostridium sp.]